MTSGITGISPIGLGFDTSSFGDYSNYMPSMMGYNMYGNGGLYGAGGYGMGMGLGYAMAPMLEYQQQLALMQNQLEYNTLNHTRQMHSGLVSNEVQAHEESLSGVIQKLLADGAVQSRIMTLHTKIKEGDQDGVCQEYDKLKENVYRTFEKELRNNGISINKADEARRIIESIYGQIVSSTARDGQDHTLEGDIEKYCGTAFQTGFMGGFKGNYSQRYREETLNHIYGKQIYNRSYKDGLKTKGKVLGTICAGFKDVGVGGVEGAGIYAVGVSMAALIATLCGAKGVGKWYGKLMSKTGWAAVAGIGITGASDIIRRTGNKQQ